jgi:hypothetical protein
MKGPGERHSAVVSDAGAVVRFVRRGRLDDKGSGVRRRFYGAGPVGS